MPNMSCQCSSGTWAKRMSMAVEGRRGRGRTKSRQKVRPRVHRGWSTCLQLCGGTPRLLWCRYPEATQICVAPWGALSSGHAATVKWTGKTSKGSFRLYYNISSSSSVNMSNRPCYDRIFETKQMKLEHNLVTYIKI